MDQSNCQYFDVQEKFTFLLSRQLVLDFLKESVHVLLIVNTLCLF